MRTILALLLAFLLQSTEPQHQPDLEPLLHDPAALQKLKILYEPPAHKSYQSLFVYGDGSIIWQAYPERLMSVTDVPTCKSKISDDRVKSLIRLMIEKHFVDLPEKRFVLVFAGQRNEELELHSIAVDDGLRRTSRTFGTGDYGGKQEFIPPDFVSIEEELKQLKDSTFPTSAKTCHLAPAIKFRN